MEEPEEVNETQRLQSNKAPICVDHGDPNEQGEDCPIIYNMGGNSEMLLNRGVGTTVQLSLIFILRFFTDGEGELLPSMGS